MSHTRCTITATIRCILFLLVSVDLLFLSCSNTSSPGNSPTLTPVTESPGTSPTLTPVTELGGKLFVAYPSPLPLMKPDTLLYQFEYSDIEPGSLSASVMTDTGSIPLTINTVSDQNTYNAAIVWVPGDESLFNATRRFSGVLTISDNTSAVTTTSDTFSIIGYKPITLTPYINSIHHNDTLDLVYIANADLISNIQVFYTRIETEKWIEIVGTTTRIADESPIRTYRTRFCPVDVFTDTSPVRIRFLLRDYTSPLPSAIVYSDTILISEYE